MTEQYWERVGSLREFGDQDRISVIIDDVPALIIRSGETYYAIEDVCTHDGQPLTDGEISEGQIECPRHGARFDLMTGQPKCMPATQPIRIFAVEVRGEEIFASSDAPEENSSATAEKQSPNQAVQPEQLSEEKPAEAGTTPVSELAPMVGDMLDELKKVVDPELFVNIVDLGLVYDITEENQDVVVTMTLTSPACPAGPQIISQARGVLESMPGVKSAEIKLTMSPPWTPEMMTDDARDQLGIF